MTRNERLWYGLWFGVAYVLVCALFIITLTEHSARHAEHIRLCVDIRAIEDQIYQWERIEFKHDHLQTPVPPILVCR